MNTPLASRALAALAVPALVCACARSTPDPLERHDAPTLAPAPLTASPPAPASHAAAKNGDARRGPGEPGDPLADALAVDEGVLGKKDHAVEVGSGKSGDAQAAQLFGAQGHALADALGGIDAKHAGSGVGGLGTAGRGGGGGGSGIGIGYGSGSGSMATRSFSVASSVMSEPAPQPGGTFAHAGVNPVVDTHEDRLSTFSIDVDTGSFMYASRFLRMGRAPTPASVRVEEFVNAMHYDYAGPKDGAFAVHVAGGPSPFTRDDDIVRVAIQGKRMTKAERKPAAITFLVDVSGSMNQEDRLPWVREGIDLAVDNLRDDDRVAIITYAGETRLVLAATNVGDNRARIHTAVATLAPGGGTNMGSGMELAYREANKELASDRSSRVIVLSDGDANIGFTGHDAILKAIKGYVSEGVTMSTMGFGSGNYNDVMMEQLADAGNGNYTYIPSKAALRRFFVDEMTSTLEVIAQDAKIQVEWNPDVVRTYRLLGYENRDIADKDFRNDKKDAGEIGAGHSVTALYEVQLVRPHAPQGDLGIVRVRHKIPRHEHAAETALTIAASSLNGLDDDGACALGMALGAEILRGSEHAAGLTLVDAARLLRASAVGPHAAERNDAAILFEKAPVQTVAAR